MVDQSSPVTTSEQQAVPVAQFDWRLIAKAAGEHGVRYRTNTALLAFLAAVEPALPCKSGEGAEAWTVAQLKDVVSELLSHRGERPERILRGGSALWETWLPAVRAALRYLPAALTPDATQTREANEVERQDAQIAMGLIVDAATLGEAQSIAASFLEGAA